MSFYCEHCGKEFEFPKAVEESRGEFWGMPAFETMYYCPYCGDDDYAEIMQMDAYGKPIYTNDYYYEVKDIDGPWQENYSEESFKENLEEILDAVCIVERKCAV